MICVFLWLSCLLCMPAPSSRCSCRHGHREVHAANTANANTMFATANAIVYCYGTTMRVWSVLVLCICVFFMDVCMLDIRGQPLVQLSLVAKQMDRARLDADSRCYGDHASTCYTPSDWSQRHWPIRRLNLSNALHTTASDMTPLADHIGWPFVTQFIFIWETNWFYQLANIDGL